MLNVSHLSLSVNDKKILDDINLDIKNGEVHVLMGPNGAGKSTICKAIFNHPGYQKKGNIFYNGDEITNSDPSEIAKKGIYILNQSPVAIEGVTNVEMLRVALEEKTGEKVSIFKFNKKMEDICSKLSIPKEFIFREINEGMSGGERKKNELLHMWMLEPSFIILDEVDSGLDVDALKIVADSINEYKEKYKPGILIVTHHEKLINYIKPDKVHVLKNGKIVTSGDYTLAMDVLSNGFNYGLNDMIGNVDDE